MHFDISQVEAYQWALAIVSAMVIGMSKAGLTGLTLMFVPLMAISFGGRASTGILLTMLCVGDLFAVAWYRRNAEWKYLLKLSSEHVRRARSRRGGGRNAVRRRVPIPTGRHHLGTAGAHGMAGRAQEGASLSAYPVVCGRGRVGGGLRDHDRQRCRSDNRHLPSVDASAQELPHRYGGLVFLIINLAKIPLHIFFWENISAGTLTFTAIMVPAIAAGAAIGILAAGRMPERAYRVFVMVMTGVAGLLLLVL